MPTTYEESIKDMVKAYLDNEHVEYTIDNGATWHKVTELSDFADVNVERGYHQYRIGSPTITYKDISFKKGLSLNQIIALDSSTTLYVVYINHVFRIKAYDLLKTGDSYHRECMENYFVHTDADNANNHLKALQALNRG